MVQRMHAAYAPAGNAIAGWEAIVRLGGATGVKRSWTHARDVFKDMVAAVPAWNGLTWTRELRPLALRFAGSRGYRMSARLNNSLPQQARANVSERPRMPRSTPPAPRARVNGRS
jgi:hypothetical protein